MANLTESSVWESGVYKLELSDPIKGGDPIIVSGTPVEGWANAQALQLANRTGYLKQQIETIAAMAISFPSYTELRTYSGVVNLSLVNDYNFGGNFKVDSTDTTSADNGGTIIVDTLGRRWKRIYSEEVNVKWFGAVGDGTTDDTSAIQAALTYSLATTKSLYFPKGKYRMTSSLSITDSPIQIFGDGMQISSIVFEGVDGIIIDNSGIITVRKSTGIEKLSILADSTNTKTGLKFTGVRGVQYSQQFRFIDSELAGVSSGKFWQTNIDLIDAGQSNIERFNIIGGSPSPSSRSNYGIKLDGTKDCKILSGNLANFNTGIFATNDSEGIVIAHNHIIAGIIGVVSDNNVGNYFDIHSNHFAVAVSAAILGSGAATSGSNHCQVFGNFVLVYDGASDHTSDDFIGFDISSNYNHIYDNEILRTTASKLRYGVRLRVTGSRTPTVNTIAENRFNAMSQGCIIDSGVTDTQVITNTGVGVSRTNMVVNNGTNTRIIHSDTTGIGVVANRHDMYTKDGLIGYNEHASPGTAVANYYRVFSHVTGNSPGIQAEGSDSNIHVRLIPKGTGTILFPIGNIQDFANDSAAAFGGIPIGGLYRNGSIVQIRVS